LAEPRERFTVEQVEYLFERHPFVWSTRIVERHPTLRRECLERVVEIWVDGWDDLEHVLRYAERLPEVKQVYNTGLIAIQWHLIYRQIPPSSLCEVEESEGYITSMRKLDDDDVIEPPPFKTIQFEIPDSTEIEKIDIYDEWQSPIASFEGVEAKVIGEFFGLMRDEEPDVIVTSNPIATTRHVLHRAACCGQDFRFGRGGEKYHGRILVGRSSFYDMGLAGLVERARFTYAPMGVSHNWEAGKTIDSRQCAEAVRLGVMVPPMKGGYGFSSSAWDLVRHDKGGMVFSPQPGLHENVGALDFESMFPHIIVRRNLSYETITAEEVDHEIDGFLGKITEPFLQRRRRFKHLRKDFPKFSRMWWYCQHRQSTLKLFLVVYYGYSGCYANRFANVRVFQKINKEARVAMVKALNKAQEHGYEVIYGPFDSLFVKKPDAEKTDFESLASEISEVTGLPIRLDNHFKYLVLLTKTTHPNMVAANRYYGKRMDGSLFYRGIELRRHDTPEIIYRMQENMIKTLFDTEDVNLVLSDQLPKALDIAHQTYRGILLGKVDSEELVISKRLHRKVDEYKTHQPHIVAAMLGDSEEMSKYILVNAENSNPYRRVMSACMIDETHKAYDRKKYAAMVRRAAWNLVRPFVPCEEKIGRSKLRESLLYTYN
jgi:DNA polymerase elongation subunit (family B)